MPTSEQRPARDRARGADAHVGRLKPDVILLGKRGLTLLCKVVLLLEAVLWWYR
jgi:hypothetical protein